MTQPETLPLAKIKPCPFCGNVPPYHNIKPDRVCCGTEDCCIGGKWIEIESWNRRSPDKPEAEAVVEKGHEHGPECDKLRGAARELHVHRYDCPTAWNFFEKHGLGGFLPSSCLVCGKSMAEQPVGIQHMELNEAVVCSTCVRQARIPEGEPFGHVHLNALAWVTHEHWLKMTKGEQEWYPIPIGKFTAPPLPSDKPGKSDD